jgi:hypothetical protein
VWYPKVAGINNDINFNQRERWSIMSRYLKISYPKGHSCSKGLRWAITYIGKHYGRRANIAGYTDREYFKHGRNFIAKRFGAFSKGAVLSMVKSKGIKDANARQWSYHKRIYVDAYAYIIKLLFKCPPVDMTEVAKLLEGLYQDVCNDSGKGEELERLCSNALLFWQKQMLSLYRANPNASNGSREDADKILTGIIKVDKPLP